MIFGGDPVQYIHWPHNQLATKQATSHFVDDSIMFEWLDHNLMASLPKFFLLHRIFLKVTKNDMLKTKTKMETYINRSEM